MNTENTLSEITIRLGQAEVSCKAREDFIESKLLQIVEPIIEKLTDTLLSKIPTQGQAENNRNTQETIQSTTYPSMSINSVIAKLGGKSCREILMASAAQISLVQGKERFSKEELVAVAKGASAFKKDYSSRVTRDLGRLTKSGGLIENAKDIFTLPDEKKSELASRLD